MRALVFQGIEQIGWEKVEDPATREPGDALIRVRLAGLCGSDLHVYHGRERGLDPGTVMGHEAVGEVVAAGPEAGPLQEGDRVHAPFSVSCGACFYCGRGLTSRCVESRLFGWVEKGEGLHGAQAELLRVPLAAATLVRVPDGVSDEEALLLGDVLSTGFFCADLSEIGPGETCAVLGCGAVGLSAILGARERGAAAVYAVDSVADRLERADAFGATPVRLGAEDPVTVLHGATGGRGADAVLEAVGTPQATRLAYEIVRPGGAIAAAGVHTEEALAFSPGEAYDKNITYRAGRCPARQYMERLAPVVQSGRYDVASILSHRLPLSRGPEAYRRFAAREPGWLKVAFVPGS